MSKQATDKFILRYVGDGDAPARDVAQIQEACDVEVLDVSSRMVLVCSTPLAVSDLAHTLSDWEESPLREVEIPDNRPKVKEATARPARTPSKTASSKRTKK